MDASPYDMAIGVGIALVIIDKFMYWWVRAHGKRNGKDTGFGNPIPHHEWTSMYQKMKDVHETVQEKDMEGVRMIYLRPSYVAKVRQIAENSEKQTQILEEIQTLLEAIADQ